MSNSENGKRNRDLSNDVEYLIAWTSDTEFREQEIHIYGNPAGLKSLAQKLMAMADIDQSNGGFPDNDSEHHHYKIGCNTESPDQHPLLTIGRVDSKNDTNSLRDCFTPIQPQSGKLAIR